ncbi:MAG: DNA polymerase III subunit gamma/tau [Oscillospiraceae bacterium]|nr:DNA polymerase III subunit gamma/tau [Oscillospiraceae bacterium]
MYQALYRKYRPVTFTDVISQQHITSTLQNQIVSGRTAHAYLFTGSRGTGKTTCARIFAKALNCEHTVNGDPCNECDICKAADNFALSDIIEIDAASNGSVDDARELREAALYTPERCRYKVYIIDEVHMLSKDAFNALLKIIEEPPAHVKFIMATTELHKVLPTILSRCQRFDFMRVRTEDIAARVKSIAEREGIKIDDDSADLIAKTADGGMRDALSILDRCIAFSTDITVDAVSDATGIAGRGYLFKLSEGMIDKDPAVCLDVINELYSRSKDMQRLCEELILQFRNILIAVTAPQRMNIIICLPSELEQIRSMASRTDAHRIMGIIDALGECIQRMRGSLNKRIDMEMCVIRLCAGNTPGGEDTDKLSARIAELEDKLRSGRIAPANDRAPERRMPLNIASSALTPIEKWQAAVDRINAEDTSIGVNMGGSTGYTQGTNLIINSPKPLLKGLLSKDYNIKKVLGAVTGITGFKLEKILVGYKPELDRSGAPPPEEKQEEAPPVSLDAVLEKAKENGVEITETN